MVEFLLCLVGGFLGLHKFYKKDYKMGLLYLFTIGLFGIGWIYDTVKLFINLITSEERKQFKAQVRLEAKERRELALAEERIKVEQLESQGIAYCPRCKSTSVQYVEHRKRLSVGRAVVGTVVLNPLWGAVGAVTSKKYEGVVKCLKCGNSWRI